MKQQRDEAKELARGADWRTLRLTKLYTQVTELDPRQRGSYLEDLRALACGLPISLERARDLATALPALHLSEPNRDGDLRASTAIADALWAALETIKTRRGTA